MSFLQSILLGIIQGITEFLPISSSAHLVLLPYLAKWNIPESQVFPFDVLVQIGTLVAVIIFFWKDLWEILKAFLQGIFSGHPFQNPAARMGWYLILATIPAGIAGLLIKDTVEQAFNSPGVTAFFLLFTALLLVIAEKIGKRTRKISSITWKDALWIGGFQVLSLFPGVSRSGSTITGGMTRQLNRTGSARFSFLMSVPVMLAAGLVSVLDLGKVENLESFIPVMAVGFVTAGITGYFSIRWLLSFLSRRPLTWFAGYCVLFSAAVFAVIFIRGDKPLAAAQSEPVSIIQAQVSPGLEWLVPAMNDCAVAQPDTGVLLSPPAVTPQDVEILPVALLWGKPDDLTGSAYVIGQESMTLAVSASHPLQKLDAALLHSIFESKIQTWKQVFEACADCTRSAPDASLLQADLHLWVYPPGSALQTNLETLFLLANLPAASLNIAPNPEAMLQALAEDPAAIGFLPSGWMDESVHAVMVAEASSQELSLPILASTTGEPQPALYTWLVCLQTALNR